MPQAAARTLVDVDRLTALRRSGLMDTPPEEVFDRFTRLLVLVLDVPVSTVTLVDDQRQFYKSHIGLPAPIAEAAGSPVEYSICSQVVLSGEPLVVSDTNAHPELSTHPAVTELGVGAYLGMPLATREGHTLGTLCVMTDAPRNWTDYETSVVRDLAAFATAEIELRLTGQDLIDTCVTVTTLEQQRDDMVHMVVHDLRSPLTALCMSMELLAESDEMPTEDRDVAAEGLTSARSLVSMVNDILDVSKSDAGKMTIEAEAFDVNGLLDDIRAQTRPLAESSKVELVTSADVAPSQIFADREKIRRAMVNLVQNAIQHCPSGSGRVECVLERLPDGAVRARVSDNGSGIPQEAHEVIFEKFGQVANGARTGPSTGLGLPFVRMAVESHGGRIRVESVPGEGSAFVFTIPQRNPDRPDRRQNGDRRSGS